MTNNDATARFGLDLGQHVGEVYELADELAVNRGGLLRI